MSEPILIMTNIDHGKDYGRDHKTVNLGYDGKCRNAKYTHKIYAFLDKSRGFPSHQKAAKFKNLTIRIEAQLTCIGYICIFAHFIVYTTSDASCSREIEVVVLIRT